MPDHDPPDPGTGPDDATDGATRRRSRAFVPIVGVIVVAVLVWIGLAVTLLRTEPEPAAPDPEVEADPDQALVEESVASGFDPLLEEGLVVGDTARLRDGGRARVRAVEADVAPWPGSPQPPEDTTLHRADVELCAGQTELFVDAAFWLGHGSDARVHSAYMGVRDLVTVTLPPGGCQRGTVEIAVADGADLDAVLLSDVEGTSASLVARWELAGAAEVDEGPLTSATEVAALGPGEAATPMTGGEAVVHHLDVAPDPDGAPDGATADDGTTIPVELDAERCAGDTPVATGPRSWLLQLDDHRLVTPERIEASFEVTELAPGGCARGTIGFVVPADAEVVAVAYTYGGSFEEARWRVGEVRDGTPVGAAAGNG
jgi:hypothetical protein